MGTQQFCLRWNNHQTNLLAVFDQLLQNEAFVDVTLACEGLSIKAHKMVLSACSPYFQSLFLDNPCQHPIVILKDVRFSELKAVVDFMYKGEVNVSQDQLSALLKTAETLKVKGLAEVTGSSPSSSGADVTRSALGVGPPPNQSGPPTGSSDGRLSPPPKRKRGRPSKRPSTDGDLEVVESLVDVVPDGPDSVPTSQERSMEANPSMKSDILSEAPQSLPEQSLNPPEMTFDGLSQEHTSNSRDSGMMIADQAQTSSSSIGQLPATASTSGMSPGQEIIPVKDEPYEDDPIPLPMSVPVAPNPSQVITTQPLLSSSLKPSQSVHTQPVPAPGPSSTTASVPMPAIPGTSSDRIGGGFDATAAATDEQMFQPFCRVCQRKFTTPETFQYHCEMHRQGFYWCEFCNKMYRDSSVFRRHLTMHDPHRKLYICYVCRRVFTWKNNLTQHLRTVHRVNIPRQRWCVKSKLKDEDKITLRKDDNP